MTITSQSPGRDCSSSVSPAAVPSYSLTLTRTSWAFSNGSSRAAASGVNRPYARAFDLLASGAGKSAFDLTQEPDAIRDRYGRNPHGQSVLQARRLVERGVPLVTVFWPNDGIKNVSVYWDTHSKNFIDHRERLMPPARPTDSISRSGSWRRRTH